jgi:hypothetical protein
MNRPATQADDGPDACKQCYGVTRLAKNGRVSPPRSSEPDLAPPQTPGRARDRVTQICCGEKWAQPRAGPFACLLGFAYPLGPFGGLADGLINHVPQQIAAALTESSTGGALDSSTQLTGDLGNLLDPSTLVGDLTTLLTGSTADLPAGLAADLVPNLAGMLLDPMTFLPF